jgi:hypothetical protein
MKTLLTVKKVLDPVILYNFDIKFDFIQDYMKKL